MRVTISINDNELIQHINSLRAGNLNVSKFFNDAAMEFIKEEDTKEKERLKGLIKEILEEEGIDFIKPAVKSDMAADKSNIKSKLNNMFADIENE